MKWYKLQTCASLGEVLGIKPDGPGPNLERFGGTPYAYISHSIWYTLKNPGY